MKTTIFPFTILIVASISLLSCSSTKSSTKTDAQEGPQVVDTGYGEALAKDTNQSNVMVEANKDHPENISLGDMIRKLPGVQVSGREPYLKIKVSGSESFMSGTDPLFVLNGTAIGNNYAQVASVVYANDVKSVSVLKGADAAIYGARGANGVILIRTKK